MKFNSTKASEQFNAIKDYTIDLQVKGNDLLAMLHVAQHAQHIVQTPSLSEQTREIMQRLGRHWQALLADPTTDFGKMMGAGWQAPQTASKTTEQLQAHLALADRTQVFELADHLETAFVGYTQSNTGLTNADIIMGLHNFYLWIILYLESSIEDKSGALRKAIIDTLVTRIQKDQPE